MKIFITGFMRSGTTLLRDLIEKHPDVKKMFHERGIISIPKKYLYKTKVLPDVRFIDRHSMVKNRKGRWVIQTQLNVKFNLKKDNWGEKIPYRSAYISKGNFRGNIIKYCNRWNNYFKSESVIIHIIRHPIDVTISSIRRGIYSKHQDCLEPYIKSVPFVIRSTQNYKNLLTIKYEDLILNPNKTLKIIFLHCKLNNNPEVIKKILQKNIFLFGKINRDRALSYMKREQNIKINKSVKAKMNELIRILNFYGETKYDYYLNNISIHGLKIDGDLNEKR